MSVIENQVFPWATGIDESDVLGRTVAVANDRWIPQLSAGGFLRPGDVLFYGGDFSDPGSVISLPDGSTVAQSRYGLAQFSWLDSPTILRITDDDDFSAFLRDADVAQATGRFAAHTIHPSAVIADLAALGGRTDGAGPDRRLFVFADGAVSTSPTGLPLGSVEDSPADLNARWRELNAESSQPCAVCLGLAVGERDRLDALAERPWLEAYVATLRRLRKRSAGSSTVQDGPGLAVSDES